MTPNEFVHKIIKQSNYIMALFGILGLLSIALGAIVAKRYLNNFISGPFELSAREVLAIDDVNAQQQYYVNLVGEDSMDTGFYDYTLNNGREKIEANYGALLFGERLLLVKTKQALGETPPKEFTGKLIALPADVQREIIRQLEIDFPELEDVFLSFMLDDTGSFRQNGYIGLAVGAIALILSAGALSVAFQRNADHARHPIMRKLSRFGDPDVIAQQIDNEVEHEQRQKIADLRITRQWLVHARAWLGALHVTRINDLMWIYPKITRTRLYGVITTSKTYELIILDRHGENINIRARKKRIDEMMEIIYSHAPWILAGHDEKLAHLWQSDRSQVIQAVDQRRQQFLADAKQASQ
jgi:hypothetical protein